MLALSEATVQSRGILMTLDIWLDGELYTVSYRHTLASAKQQLAPANYMGQGPGQACHFK